MPIAPAFWHQCVYIVHKSIMQPQPLVCPIGWPNTVPASTSQPDSLVVPVILILLALIIGSPAASLCASWHPIGYEPRLVCISGRLV